MYDMHDQQSNSQTPSKHVKYATHPLHKQAHGSGMLIGTVYTLHGWYFRELWHNTHFTKLHPSEWFRAGLFHAYQDILNDIRCTEPTRVDRFAPLSILTACRLIHWPDTATLQTTTNFDLRPVCFMQKRLVLPHLRRSLLRENI